MVEHLVRLVRDQSVELSDPGIEHGFGVAGHRDGAREHLRYELLDHVPPALAGRRLAAEPPPLDDLVEQAQLGGLRRGLLRLLCLRIRHPYLPRAWRRHPAPP